MISRIQLITLMIYFFNISQVRTEKSLHLPIIKLHSSFLMMITIKDKNNNTIDYYKELDQEAQYSLFNLVDESQKKLTEKSLYFYSRVLKVYDNKEIIYLSDEQNKMIYSYYTHIDSDNRLYKDIPLSYSFIDTKYSFLHQLQSQGLIDKLIYCIEPLNRNNDDGILHLGGYNESITNNKHSLIINVNPNYSTWGGNFDGLFIGDDATINNTILEKYYFYFLAGKKHLLLPKKLYEYVKKNVMSEKIKKGLCKEFERDEVECLCLDKERAIYPKINFIIEGKIITMNFDDLFDYELGVFYKQTEFFCRVLVKINPNKDIVVLGGVFMSKFISIFDYEKGIISLYSNQEFQVFGNKNKNNAQSIILIIIIVIGIEIFDALLLLIIKN